MSDTPSTDAQRVANALRFAFPSLSLKAIVDVGANIGQLSLEYAETFPTAAIYAIEPAPDSYRRLVEKTAGQSRIHTYSVALGDRTRRTRMYTSGESKQNKVANVRDVLAHRLGRRPQKEIEIVEMVEGDLWAEQNQVERISLLKVDTEGYDLRVVKGFRRMIASETIDVVQVEAGVNSEKHVNITSFLRWFEARRYRLFGIHGQMLEKNRPILRRCNLLFVSDSCSAANRQGGVVQSRALDRYWQTTS